MFQVEIQTRGLAATLARLRASIKDASPLMAGIAQEMRAEVNQHLQDQAGPEGKWPGLSKRTIARRTKKGTWPGRMLQVTGQLASSVQASHDAQSAMISSGLPYAAIHQFGGKAGRGRKVSVPARAYFPLVGPATNADLSDRATSAVESLVQDYLERRAAAGGG